MDDKINKLKAATVVRSPEHYKLQHCCTRRSVFLTYWILLLNFYDEICDHLSFSQQFGRRTQFSLFCEFIVKTRILKQKDTFVFCLFCIKHKEVTISSSLSGIFALTLCKRLSQNFPLTMLYFKIELCELSLNVIFWYL